MLCDVAHRSGCVKRLEEVPMVPETSDIKTYQGLRNRLEDYYLTSFTKINKMGIQGNKKPVSMDRQVYGITQICIRKAPYPNHHASKSPFPDLLYGILYNRRIDLFVIGYCLCRRVLGHELVKQSQPTSPVMPLPKLVLFIYTPPSPLSTSRTW